jgi:hypothetical protein
VLVSRVLVATGGVGEPPHISVAPAWSKSSRKLSPPRAK